MGYTGILLTSSIVFGIDILYYYNSMFYATFNCVIKVSNVLKP